MSTDSRQDLFEEAKRLRKEQKEKEAQNKSYSKTEYEDPVFASIEFDNPKIVRLLGNPKIKRNDDPFSPKDVWISWLLGDNDSKFRCVWPIKSENPNWILWKIYDKVMAYKWDKTLNGGEGGRVYLNAETHKSSFIRVAKNNDVENKMENGWKPTKYVVFNCVDRLDNAWHQETKHTKFLSKKNKEPGIPPSVYDKIWDDIVEHYGSWEKYDIALWKAKTGPLDSDVEYKVLHTSHIQELPANVREFIIDAPLTEEEKSWERYNFDQMYKITSYQKIKRNLGAFIKSIDTAFKTKYTEELELLVEEEIKKYQELNKENISKFVSNQEEKKEEKLAEKKEESVPTSTPARRRTVTEPHEFSLNDLDPSIYKGISKLNQQSKDLIVGIKENGNLIYKEGTGTPLGCSNDECEFPAPEIFNCCPKCGINF